MFSLDTLTPTLAPHVSQSSIAYCSCNDLDLIHGSGCMGKKSHSSTLQIPTPELASYNRNELGR